MALLEKYLRIKKSTIPDVGKGLFTTIDIKKGDRILEYKGEAVTWKEVENMPEDRNGYVFYFTAKYCLDAWNRKDSLGRYANDARGIVRLPGVNNNAEFVTEKKRCFMEAIRNIPKGGEILVAYGAEYWRAIRHNIKLEEERNGKALLPHNKLRRSKKAKKKRLKQPKL